MNNLQGALHSSSVRILPPSIHASILFDQRSPVNVEKSFWEAEYLVPNCTPLIVVSLITRRDLTSNAISSLPDGVFKGMTNLFYLYVLAKRICPSIHPSSLPSIYPSSLPSIHPFIHPSIHPSTERFHMTSRRPYWCSKTIKRRPRWCSKPILWELNSFLM